MDENNTFNENGENIIRDESTLNVVESTNNMDDNYGYSESTQQYSENNSNYNNPEFNYNAGDKNFKKKKKGSGKKLAVVVSSAAFMVLIAFSGGLLGGYLFNKSNTNVNELNQAKSYAAPEFLSSDSDTLTVAQAIEKVKPAVVTISTKTIVNAGGYYGGSVQEGIGSGFIINEEGYILTNYHVVEGANEVSVLLSTGEEVGATVVNYDQEKDIAMVKLADGVKVPGVATLGDSDALYAGQEVIAIGTPLSKEFTATSTKGIISAINRNVETSTGVTMNLIQTDAAINPGNSGGPLINSNGEVIGINSMKLVTTEVEGIGFAIPIQEASERIETLSKPIITLGISIVEVNEELSEKTNYPIGLYVKDITDFSIAQKAGMKIADVITSFDGKKIETVEDLSKAKAEKEVGDKVKITVIRDEKEVELEMTLE